ncbi:hypothetical protein ACIA5G_01525 [Amycolatopsis sp. NPDC051758]|uniref:hypothetical protein n=1 Tax=Amycolatopsis sp. NPDC051758 TaxID=3363935 RepID=UPI003794AAA2
MTYAEVETSVGKLIHKYAPGPHSVDVAAAAFINLERTLWDVTDSRGTAIANSPLQSGSWLKARRARGTLKPEFVRLLNYPETLLAVIETLLGDYFKSDIAEDIRTELGLDLLFRAPATSPLRRYTSTVTRRVQPVRDESLEFDTRLRLQAFTWLSEASKEYGNRIPSSQLGLFTFEDERIALADQQQGIRKPKVLKAALSIKTAYTPPSRRRPYDDEESDDGLVHYKYRGDDPNLFTNVALRRAFQERRPLIYFVGVASGLYEAKFPLWVIADEPDKLEIVASFDPPEYTDPIWLPWVQPGPHVNRG